jgi:hypothetical protein
LSLNTGQNCKKTIANKLFEGVAKQMKIVFKKELRADQIWGMLALIPFRIFCFPFCSPKKVRIKIYKTVTLPVVILWM